MNTATLSLPIHECVVTSQSAEGVPHVAPMGARYDQGRVLLSPFRPSTTLDNILATGHAVLNLLTDARVFAGCVTGRRDWPLAPAEHIPGRRLRAALRHVELRLDQHREDPQRPLLLLRPLHAATHGHFMGLNRAQAAVVEGAVLVSRLRLLPPEKVDAELAYLQIAIDRTAGAAEREAWGWLLEAVELHRRMTTRETLS